MPLIDRINYKFAKKRALMYHFSNETMFQIINILQNSLKSENKVEFIVLNPDEFSSFYAGQKVQIENKQYIYRSYKAWIDLAESLFCRFKTPIIIENQLVKLTFEKLNKQDSFHKQELQKEEKYGIQSTFNQINKNEEPAFLLSYINALKNVKVENRIRILNLGVNKADEFEVIKNLVENFSSLELIGIDYSQSAIDEAKQRFKEFSNVSFLKEDINNLESLNLGEFDLIISIGTLQSSSINFNLTFMSIVQNFLKKEGAMILGFPNCRWIDGEMIYGAMAKNYSYSEMSLLYKDAVFCKKYLQQKKFRVTLTGKNYIFLTATSIRK